MASPISFSGISGSGDDQIEIALLHLRGGGQDDQLTIHTTQPYAAVWLEKGDVRNVERGACPDQGEHIRVILLIGGENRGMYLNFVEVVSWEEWSRGAVNQARSQSFLGAGAGLAFDEPAREFTRGVGSFPILHLEREKVAAGDR
jgi:hypothetical protein